MSSPSSEYTPNTRHPRSQASERTPLPPLTQRHVAFFFQIPSQDSPPPTSIPCLTPPDLKRQAPPQHLSALWSIDLHLLLLYMPTSMFWAGCGWVSSFLSSRGQCFICPSSHLRPRALSYGKPVLCTSVGLTSPPPSPCPTHRGMDTWPGHTVPSLRLDTRTWDSPPGR